ncbi:hypothetical protein CHH77_02325 [Shouchella clausii]|uniref:DUF3168 domain-containing protein n=1 Tax=Shouchella clausii TaxID=79880 RepID=UPI000BA77C73|nr:DUF3168 domain-containing protein [Shouchella clausii]PAE84974.1 hypothetical protein CHH77_02325 [Shouchella clausii]
MTTKLAIRAVNKAIIQALKTNDEVKALVDDRVYARVPEGTPFPYIRVGEANVLPYDTKTSFGEQVAFVVHAWSIKPTNTEVFAMLNAVHRALTSITTIPDFSLRSVGRTNYEVFDDIDGKSVHGVYRIQYIVNNKE